MKKLIMTAAAVFAFGFANAQDVKFGAKAGLNVATFGGDAEEVSSKVGFQVGGFAEIKVSDKFAVQPELLFNSIGTKVKGADVSLSLNYISIPVMAKYFVTEQFSLEAGPQAGILATANANAAGASVDVKESFNSLDFGLNAGVGYDITENINASARYSFGLANIAKDSPNYKATNNVISIALGYKF